MRLFIAIQLSETLRNEIVRMQEEFKKRCVTGNYTKRENLHLTLAFIGEYPDAQRVIEAMETVRLSPFELRLKGIGAFGDLWWAGLEESEALRGYVKDLRRALAEAGIPFDRKRFAPHITIVRRAAAPGQMPILTAPRGAMIADHVSLMRSDRGNNGMIYTELS